MTDIISYSLNVDDFFDMNDDEVEEFIHKDKLNSELYQRINSSKKDLSSEKVKVLELKLPQKQKTNDQPSKIKEMFFSSRNKDTIEKSICTEDEKINSIDTASTVCSTVVQSNQSLSSPQEAKSRSFSFNINPGITSNHKKNLKNNDFYEFPSVGVGILLVHNDRILLGRRIDSGMYGLPGGWLEFCEDWNECAARELKEETGISMPSSAFNHIYTINSINTERRYHSVSCVMFGFMNEKELPNLINKEPNKCYGWFWISLKEMRNMYSLLFYPLREFLIKNSKIEKASEFKKLVKEKLDIDFLFDSGL